MNFKIFILLALLALVSLGGVSKLAAQASTQVLSPLSTPPRAACAIAPVLDQDEWGPTDKPLITAVAAQQIAEAHAQAGCARQIKLDEEDCRLVYKIKIAQVKVEVDALTGAVLDTDYSDD
jgi:uncharacterized membrane protein YkoI